MKKRVLRGHRGEAAAVGTVESENLLLERGKENRVSVKVGNINPMIFLSFNSCFPLHASFSCPLAPFLIKEELTKWPQRSAEVWSWTRLGIRYLYFQETDSGRPDSWLVGHAVGLEDEALVYLHTNLRST